MDRWKLIGVFGAGLALAATGPGARAQFRLEFNYCDRLDRQTGRTFPTLLAAEPKRH